MKFLVDAQLPNRLAERLIERGHDAVHTSSLPSGNATPDAEINRLSLAEERVVVTKDRDFAKTFVLHRIPWRLLLVATGNTRNADLLMLFDRCLPEIELGFSEAGYLELTATELVVRG